MRTVLAAVLYFLIVFGVGFLLGPIRVWWLEPRFGNAAAVLLNLHFCSQRWCWRRGGCQNAFVSHARPQH